MPIQYPCRSMHVLLVLLHGKVHKATMGPMSPMRVMTVGSRLLKVEVDRMLKTLSAY